MGLAGDSPGNDVFPVFGGKLAVIGNHQLCWWDITQRLLHVPVNRHGSWSVPSGRRRRW